MRILLVHRYFWPDVAPYAQMLRVLAQHYVREGHEVSVFTSQPSYNQVRQGDAEPSFQEVDGYRVFRLGLFSESKKQFGRRALNSLLFAAGLFWHCLTRRAYDLMTVSTMPPVVMGMVARYVRALRGTSYIYHCLDMHPEASIVADMLRSGWLSRIWTWFDCRNCRKAAAVVVLSADMRTALCERGLADRNIKIINNFVIDESDYSDGVDASLQKPAKTFRILFTGNIGRFQGLEVVIDAAKQLAEYPDIHFVFVGAGGAIESLREQAGERLNQTVFFHPFQPFPVVQEMMRDADLALISLKPGVIKYAYPSKTMMYLSAGCRILAVVESNSELARFIKEKRVGVTCPSGDSRQLADCILKEYHEAAINANDHERIRQVAEDTFSQSVILSQWSKLMHELEASRT